MLAFTFSLYWLVLSQFNIVQKNCKPARPSINLLVFVYSLQNYFRRKQHLLLSLILQTVYLRTSKLFSLIDASLSSDHDKATVVLSYGRTRTRLGIDHTVFKALQLIFDLFPCRFAARSKPPSRDHHC